MRSLFPVYFRVFLRKKIGQGEISPIFWLEKPFVKKEPKNVSLITNFHKLFFGFKVKVASRYIFVRLQITIDVTSRFQEYLHHLGCPNREAQVIELKCSEWAGFNVEDWDKGNRRRIPSIGWNGPHPPPPTRQKTTTWWDWETIL